MQVRSHLEIFPEMKCKLKRVLSSAIRGGRVWQCANGELKGGIGIEDWYPQGKYGQGEALLVSPGVESDPMLTLEARLT